MCSYVVAQAATRQERNLSCHFAIFSSNICLSSLDLSIPSSPGYLDEVQRRRQPVCSVCARVFVRMDRSPESQLPFSHYGDCSPSPARERGGSDPELSRVFFLLIIIAEVNVLFSGFPNASVGMCCYCALFRCDIGNVCLLCRVRGLGSELTGWK